MIFRTENVRIRRRRRKNRQDRSKRKKHGVFPSSLVCVRHCAEDAETQEPLTWLEVVCMLFEYTSSILYLSRTNTAATFFFSTHSHFLSFSFSPLFTRLSSVLTIFHESLVLIYVEIVPKYVRMKRTHFVTITNCLLHRFHHNFFL